MDFPGKVVESFLRHHPGSFCADCLAQILELPAGQISMVIRRLQDAADFRSEAAICSQCHRRVSVVRGTAAG